MTHPFVRVVFSYVFNRRLPAARSDGIGLQFDRIPVMRTILLPTFATAFVAFVAPFTAAFAMSPPGTNTTIDAPNSSHACLREAAIHHVFTFSRSNPLSLADFNIFAASSPQMRSGCFPSLSANSRSVRANPNGATWLPGMSTTDVPIPANSQLPHVTH